MISHAQLTVDEHPEVRHRRRELHAYTDSSDSSVTVSLSSCCRVPSQISCVLSAFILSRLLLIQASTFSTHHTNCCTVVMTNGAGALYSCVSSAYEWLVSPVPAVMSNNSAVYSRNSSGPSTQPCGSPHSSSSRLLDRMAIQISHWKG